MPAGSGDSREGWSEIGAARSSQAKNVESIREANSYLVGRGGALLLWVWYSITIRPVVEDAKEMELKPLCPHRKLHLPLGADHTCSFHRNDARLGTRLRRRRLSMLIRVNLPRDIDTKYR